MKVNEIILHKIEIKKLLKKSEMSSIEKCDPIITGVYFLVLKDEIQYIGGTENILKRMNQHKDKKFDQMLYIECDKHELNLLESFMIHMYEPKINGKRSNEKCAPYTKDSLRDLVCGIKDSDIQSELRFLLLLFADQNIRDI